ncbi:Hsp70 family protein [Desulfobacter postgatei]
MEQYLGESVRDAVITIPAYFDDSQPRTKIKKAIGRLKKPWKGKT